jgi:hypothetical protein
MNENVDLTKLNIYELEWYLKQLAKELVKAYPPKNEECKR